MFHQPLYSPFYSGHRCTIENPLYTRRVILPKSEKALLESQLKKGETIPECYIFVEDAVYYDLYLPEIERDQNNLKQLEQNRELVQKYEALKRSIETIKNEFKDK